MVTAVVPRPAESVLQPASIIGLADLMRLAYRGEDLTPVWSERASKLDDPGMRSSALMDMSTILQLSGQRDRGLQVQQTALQISRIYRRPHGNGGGLKVLALVVDGDFMANTPIDFLLQGSDFELTYLFLDRKHPMPSHVPVHDVCVLAISESADNAPVLERLAPMLANWPKPVLNGSPEQIAKLSRDGVCALFVDNPLADDPFVVVAKTVRATRRELAAMQSAADLARLLPGAAFPIIVRPVDTHAGNGLVKIDAVGAVSAYLGEHSQSEFYVAPFIDYSGADGLFRKQRIAFIGGNAFISHLAISEHWMVHYLSAGMTDDAAKRNEEARFFDSFDTAFASRHQAAFARLRQKLGLDYFTIDCAELTDGRLLVFEVDVAMIVHDLDPVDLFPYKKPAMAKLFTAFQAHLEAMRS